MCNSTKNTIIQYILTFKNFFEIKEHSFISLLIYIMMFYVFLNYICDKIYS